MQKKMEKEKLQKTVNEIKDLESNLLGEWAKENNASKAAELIADVNRLKRSRNQLEQIIDKIERREEKEKEKKE